MVLEVLFLFLLIAGIAIISYRGAVHEFQILQKTYDDEGANLSELLTEMLPIVVRNVPKRWLGSWTANRIGMKPYEIQVRDANSNKYKIPWNLWLQDPKGTRPVSLEPVAASLRLDTASSAMSDDGFSRWFMLPHSTPVPQLLHSKDVLPLTKTVPEFTVITVTDGAPVEVWLAHEGAIPSDELFGENPWEITSDQISWISDVKYVEIRLRPNNTLAIPRHWSYAVRNVEDAASWFHITAFHTPISKVVSVLKGGSSSQEKRY